MRDSGIDSVVVARLEPGDVPEDDAAMQVARALGGADVDIGNAGTGRVNLYARHAGLLIVDAVRIHAANAVHEGLTVATQVPARVLFAILMQSLRLTYSIQVTRMLSRDCLVRRQTHPRLRRGTPGKGI